MIKQLKSITIIFAALLTFSCNGQKQTNSLRNQEADLKISEELINKEMEAIKYDSGDVITDATVDGDGNIWFTTTREGVYKYDGVRFTNYTEVDGLSHNKLWSVMEDAEGILWFGTNDGLCKYDQAVFTHIPLPKVNKIYPNDNPEKPISSANAVASLIQDKNKNIWIGTAGSGVYRYSDGAFTSFLSNEGWKQSDSLHFNVIQSIVEDTSGNIWFTSMTHGGISRFDGKSFTHFTKDDGLPDDMIFSSFMDSDGTLWFGTLDEGLITFKNESFSYFDEDDGLCNNMVSSFYQDKTGKLWIGSFRGSTVCWFDGKKFTSVPFDNEQNLVELRFIIEDKLGNIWFGGRYGILWRYDGNELKDFTYLKRNK